MKKLAAAIASIALLVLPGLTSAQSYYDYSPSYGYGGYDYGYPSVITGYASQGPYYNAYNSQMPEYACNGYYQYTPCNNYMNYGSGYSPYTTYNYPQTYMPQSYYAPQSNYYTPQSYAHPNYQYPQQSYPYMNNMLQNANTNTNTNNNVNNNNITISNGSNVYYIPGYGYYRW